MDVRMLTVGQIAENCFLFRKEEQKRAAKEAQRTGAGQAES